MERAFSEGRRAFLEKLTKEQLIEKLMTEQKQTFVFAEEERVQFGTTTFWTYAGLSLRKKVFLHTL